MRRISAPAIQRATVRNDEADEADRAARRDQHAGQSATWL